MNEGIDSEGVHLKVVEVAGGPGDAVIAHPGIIHSRSINLSNPLRPV
jgi:hypothetical protein